MGGLKETEGRLTQGIMGVEDHFLDSRINNHLRTHDAGRKRRVEGGPMDVDPVIGRLGDRIFFRVGAKTLPQLGA